MSRPHVFSPIQIYSLFKSCAIIFVIQALIVLFSPIPLVDPWRFLLLAINMIISIILGWRLYKYRYHMAFSYDEKGFTLKKGKGNEIKHEWNDFAKVSLFRSEYGELSVRLYRDSEFFDLPVSKLKVNPFDFRFEVMRLVCGGEPRN